MQAFFAKKLYPIDNFAVYVSKNIPKEHSKHLFRGFASENRLKSNIQKITVICSNQLSVKILSSRLDMSSI